MEAASPEVLAGQFEMRLYPVSQMKAPARCRACRKAVAAKPSPVLYDGYCYDCLVDRVAEALDMGALTRAWREELRGEQRRERDQPGR